MHAMELDQGGVYNFPDGGSYQEFIECCLLKNEPCLFGEWATRNWGARTKWLMPDGSLNITHLIKEFGDARVPVADCTQCRFSAHPKVEMLLSEFMQYWQTLPLSASGPHHPKLAAWDEANWSLSSEGKKLLYLKDWHLSLEFPEQAASLYSPPIFMSSDWLNEAWTGRQDVNDDYKFVYMGPAGTWTPFHADVLRSYSWSANVTGCKEWLLFPPKEENKLRDKFGHLPFNVMSEEVQKKIKLGQALPPVRVIQGPGEVIFVPSGWHHQVRNLEPTVSINYNWSNAFCLESMWHHLEQELELVRLELQDCRTMEGWEQQCQVVLRASAGMNYEEFAQFIVLLGCPRLQHFKELVKKECSPKSLVVAESSTVALEHFMETVMNDRSKLTFFSAETSLSSLMCQQVPDKLSKCLHPRTPLQHLLQVLPSELRHVVEEMRSQGHLKKSMLTFRSFEVYTLSNVAEKVGRALHKLFLSQ